MKQLFIFLSSLFLYQTLYAQAGTGFSVQGSSSNSVTIQCNDNTTNFVYQTFGNFCNQNVDYVIELIKDGSAIESETINGDDLSMECIYSPSGDLLSAPPVFASFSLNNPQSGTYKMHYKAVAFGLVLDQYYSNVITVINPFYGGYLGCGSSYDNSGSLCKDDIRIYDFEEDTLLFAMMEKGMIYKVKKNFGTGYNMLAIDDNTLTNLPGYNYIVGYQKFNKKINAIEYTSDNQLLIGFNDGKILKVNNLGGSGANMFAVNETSSGFQSVSGYNYYRGHHQFDSKITEIKHINGKTFVCLGSGKILKVNGSGGTGANLFAINETSNGFTSYSGYSYYAGHAKFSSSVYRIFSNSSHTFFSFNNNKLLKINSVGGGGMNMFAVDETSNGFAPIPGYNYYVGQTLLDGKVTDMEFQGAYTTLGFSNGKLLKVNGTGGSGMNMFAIDENANGFSPIPGYNYYVGHVKYSAEIKEILTVAPLLLKPITFVTLKNGKLLKIAGIGGTGSNMYNATENSSGFSTTSTAYGIYLIGSSRFDTEPTDIAYIPQTNLTILSFANRKMFKSIGTGGSGTNCFAVSQEDNGFAPLVGYNYVTGTQIFPCLSFRREVINEESKESDISIVSSTDDPISINNPFNNQLIIDLSRVEKYKNASIQINNINGQQIYRNSINSSNEIITTDSWSKGMYFCIITIDNNNYFKKIIKE